MNRAARLGDRASLAGMGLGLVLLFLPLGSAAFHAGFFVVLASTAAQIVFAHLAVRRP